MDSPDISEKDLVMVAVGVLILGGVIAGFYFLLKKDGEDQKNNLESNANSRKREHERRPRYKPSQPATEYGDTGTSPL